MFGLSMAWIPAKGLRRLLPWGTVALFRKQAAVQRGDVVLIRHPEHGALVRRVFAVSRRGGVSFEPLPGMRNPHRNLGILPPERVLGRLVFRII